MNTKIIIWIVAIVVLAPLLVRLWPKPLTYERIQAGLKAQGLTLENVHESSPSLEAVAQLSMTIDGATVEIYQYDDEGKVATQLTYQQPDPGQAIVEASGLREALGAAPVSPIKTDATRRGMFMLTVSSDNAEVRVRVIKAFKSF
ncbi:MAG: hypothetical protein HZB26_18800 [Candidatus Hydrogenedentes bacterium]|nr:hypothetical protein [Candidatus Hydrogenedentota bacterium]